jgi:hypothetical protein
MKVSPFTRSHNLSDKKNEKFNLFWLCGQTGRKHPAGVAFFNEAQGDYRLKIDTMPDEKMIYLKVASLNENVVHYRVESAIKKAGRVIHRSEIGTGYSKSDEGGYPIYMDIGPYSRTLVLEQLA